MKHQEDDGSWSYSLGDSRNWIDNFHTAYVIDCLDEYINLSGDVRFKFNLEKGIEFYTSNFFEHDGRPRYFSNKTYPIDSTSAAQSITTLARFEQYELAEEVLFWMIDNMHSSKGYFFYQKHRLHITRISFMRWSNAWMLLAIGYYLFKTE